ncbi:MAG: hypothetical protein EA402_01230 [Planctomycetota bacterium]|nr:MAG: hypothetical protein EA402_01230 [Planctomycetota bacterium]
MHLFTCSNCGNRLYFENVTCTRCGMHLGFIPERMELCAIQPTATPNLWRIHDSGVEYRSCANYHQHAVCNWMVRAEDESPFCIACQLNHTIPDLSIAGNHALWHTLEIEKRRLVYSLLRLGLPVIPRDRDENGLAFNFMADSTSPFNERDKVLTGHADGMITINIQEADPAMRERLREELAEPYRTLLGHFRHESGHFYWDRLIRNTPWLNECRQLFGDDSLDYGQALNQHYQQGPPNNWEDHYISSYATMHPWEDWAETWAHYLHMVDTLETAWQFGLGINPMAGDDINAPLQTNFDPYQEATIEALIEHWLPLTFALNSLNRSMGHAHAYPFVLSPTVSDKLGFVHRVVRSQKH